MIFYYILLYVNIELLIYGNIFLFDVKKYVSNTHILIFLHYKKKIIRLAVMQVDFFWHVLAQMIFDVFN